MGFDPDITNNKLDPFTFFYVGQEKLHLEFLFVLYNSSREIIDSVVFEKYIDETNDNFRIPFKPHRLGILPVNFKSIELKVRNLDTNQELTKGKRPIVRAIPMGQFKKKLFNKIYVLIFSIITFLVTSLIWYLISMGLN